MNDQNVSEQSYLNLSAFLCLESKISQQNHQIDNVLTLEETKNNLTDPSIKYPDQYSHSDQQSKDLSSINQNKSIKQKKEKKEYSKNYRRRHKEYVESIKIMNQKYERRIQQLTLKVDQLNEQVRCLKYGVQISDNMFDSPFMKEKEQTFKELVNESEKKNETSWQRVKEFAQFYGFAGKEKINLLNYYMSQIIDNLLIDHQKNFVLNGLDDFQFTKSYSQALHNKECEIMETSNEEINVLKKYLKKWMPETLKKFHKTGQHFYQSYVNLISEAKQIENYFTRIEDGLFKMLNADRYLSVLRWFQENKHCKQIQLMRKDWIESFRMK